MIVNATNVHKSFDISTGSLPVLRGVDLSLKAGEQVALTGESGSGKSTLLYLIAGLDSANKGTIEIDGVDLAALDDKGRTKLRRTRLGVIFQQFNLIPSIKVRDNLRFHARLAGRNDGVWNDYLAEKLGLQDHLDRYPEQLSGGQQQRVAIGRTLAARPAVVLADEPTGNLDEETGDAVIALMSELVQETNAGLLMVTHSSRLAQTMERRVHLTSGRLTL